MRRILIAVAVLVVVTAACAPKRVVRHPPEASGFLDDYSILRKGGPNEVQLVYRNPEADWNAYSKILFEPVTLWRSGKKSLDAIPEEDLLRLVSSFETALRTRFGEEFQLVDTAGPGVMRIRLGITEARAADPVLDVLAARAGADARSRSAEPLHSEMKRFIERADVEGEIRDSQTGVLLAEGVDRRRQDGTAPALSTWADVDRALDAWAERLCSRLDARTTGRQYRPQ